MNFPGEIVCARERGLLAKYTNYDHCAVLKTYLDDGDFLLVERNDLLFLIERINGDEWLALHSSGILVYAFYDSYQACKI